MTEGRWWHRLLQDLGEACWSLRLAWHRAAAGRALERGAYHEMRVDELRDGRNSRCRTG